MFVNHLGQPLNIEALKKSAKKKSSRPQADSYHKGWRVVGFPPDQVERGKQDHLTLSERLREQGRQMLPWDLDRFMRDTRPSKVRSKPYETESAAQDAKELAVRSGWLGVRIEPVTKGAA